VRFFGALAVPFVVVALIPIACRGEAVSGECEFRRPLQVVKLPSLSYAGVYVARRDTEPEMLLYATGRLSEDEKTQEVVRIFTEIRQFEREWIPYQATPPGYQWFASRYPTHPLIQSSKIRFEYLGQKSEVLLPISDIDGRLRFENRSHFTGTRRIMYGNGLLLQQGLTNWTDIVSVGTFVQIEPDGDRIVLMCTDSSGTYLGVFSRVELDREANATDTR
jgi:hypothetical protein